MTNHSSLFELRISSLEEAAKISQLWATHTISILDSPELIQIMDEMAFYEKLIPQPRDGLSLCRSYFDDVTPDEGDFGLVLATLMDIQTILNFSANLTPHDKLLVHCSAGISRSTAVATGILCQHGLSPTAALEKVFTVRQHAAPNFYIIALLDEVLELEGELKNALQKY